MVLLGGFWAWIKSYRDTHKFVFLKPDIRALGLWALSAWMIFMVLMENILGHDAFHIWFRAGLKLFEAGNLFLIDWKDPVFASYSHPDYPKLLGILSAQASWVLGLWNDRWPKLGIFPLLAFVQTGFYALPYSNRKTWAACFLLFAGVGYLLWNGYLDGYLALTAFLAVVFLGHFLRSAESGSLWCGISSLALLTQMKNEGLFLACAVFAAFWASKGRRFFPLIPLLKAPAFWILAAPFMLWTVLKTYWGLQSDMSQNFVLATPLARVVDPDFWSLFWHHVSTRAPLPLALFGIVLGACCFRSQTRKDPVIRMTLISFVLYACFIVATYLSTFWMVKSHLESSFWRFVLPLYGIILPALLEIIPRRTVDTGNRQKLKKQN